MENEIKEVDKVEETKQDNQPQQENTNNGNADSELVFGKLKKYIDMRLDDFINKTKEVKEVDETKEVKKEVEQW